MNLSFINDIPTPFYSNSTFKVNLEDEAQAHNLHALITAPEAARFREKGGKIYRICLLREKWLRLRGQLGDVKTAVFRTLQGLNQALESSQAPESFGKLLLSKLRRLSTAQFDRSVIKEGSNLEKLFAQADFFTARAAYLADPKSEERLIDRALAEIEFAKQLGIELKSIGKGATGAKFGLNRFGAPIVVIKTEGQSSFWRRHIKPPVFNLNAEYDFWVMDRGYKTNVVPTTALRVLKSDTFRGSKERLCSVQVFVDESRTLQKALKMPRFFNYCPRSFVSWFFRTFRSDELKELPPGLVNHVAVHDIVVDNEDGHLENYLIAQAKEAPDLQDPAFFEHGHYSSAVRQFLRTEEGKILVAIDGGGADASVSRPKRYKHFIEVVVDESAQVPEDLTPLFVGQETVVETLRDKRNQDPDAQLNKIHHWEHVAVNLDAPLKVILKNG